MKATLSIDPNFRSRFDPRPHTRQEFERMVSRLPEEMMMELGAKLYLLANLTIGYMETVFRESARLRLESAKKPVRELKELRRRYDQFRAGTMGELADRQEAEMSEWFEESFGKDFDNLFRSLELQASKHIREEGRIYVIAVQQCLTLFEGCKRYARYCDDRIKERGAYIVKYAFLQDDFLKMHEVMKKLPGAMDPAFTSHRDTSARIIENRLHELEVGVKDGKIWMGKKGTDKN